MSKDARRRGPNELTYLRDIKIDSKPTSSQLQQPLIDVCHSVFILSLVTVENQTWGTVHSSLDPLRGLGVQTPAIWTDPQLFTSLLG